MQSSSPTLARSPGLPPPVLSWRSENLPRREVRALGRIGSGAFGAEAPPHWPTGPQNEPFDFSARIRDLTADIATRCVELRHIDPSRILFTFTQARRGKAHGLQARVTPMRFQSGERTGRHWGKLYRVQSFFVDDREMLYLVTFCLPRFLNQSFDEKLVTLFHELFHIGPKFDGDIRRLDGHCHIHSRSQKNFDAKMAQLARAYLRGADPQWHAFLRLDFAQLRRRHGQVVGLNVPRPKLIPIHSATEY